ncbi:hypothetical protein mru_1656 [Methanobrevibacter ruminantium M1]|uniref:Uncharacterized protein n=1 Tax=Methanobrevibacter ruminantium (strain ATCC 35063 / DSM 1093 / JCM 13430 / OCM 146 / M1) TaxID=634498 RepID=D3E4W2_METRM|nr:hypothetical protein mru_1656 [Methanobrevibacter ruminantium M1]
MIYMMNLRESLTHMRSNGLPLLNQMKVNLSVDYYNKYILTHKKTYFSKYYS